MEFAKAARERQARFRDSSGTISDAARRPLDDKGRRHGHLLRIGCEEENLYPLLRGLTGARRFFAERGIRWWRSSRSGDLRGIDGPTRNLASSQVCCVNFLLPLAQVPGALDACLRAIDPEVGNVVPLRYGGLDSRAEFEWIGLSSSLEGGPFTRGANATSADALLVAEHRSAQRRAYLFEWKYVEEYRVGEWLGEGESGDTRRYRYRHLYQSGASSFNASVPLDELLYEPVYQIVRLRLLGDKMVGESEFGVSDARVVVVCPEGNLAYRNRITSPPLAERLAPGATLEEAVGFLLDNPAGFVMTSPERLIGALRRADLGRAIGDWLAYHEERYGW